MSSSGAPLSVDLPLPDFGDHMNGRMVDESRFNRRLSGSERLVEARGRLAFTFGYKDLDSDTAELLIEILSTRLVTLTPRTARDSDPSGAGAEEIEYQCRVVGRIPFTRHLTLGYRITVNLEETLPGAQVPQDDLSPPPYLGGGFPNLGGVSPDDPEPSPLGGAGPGDACHDTRTGTWEIPSGESLIYVVPDPLMPLTLTDPSARVNVTLQPYEDQGQNVWIGEIGEYHFTIETDPANPGPGSMTGRYTMVMEFLTEDCLPCWRKNTWHTSSSLCAPFPDLISSLPAGNWHGAPAAANGRVLGSLPTAVENVGHANYGTLYLYDLDDQSWSNSPPLPARSIFDATPDLRGGMFLCPLGGRWYAFGGFHSLMVNRWAVFSWAEGESEWTVEGFELPNTPAPGTHWRGFGAQVLYGGDWYIIGGTGGPDAGGSPVTPYESVLRFDGSGFTSVHTFSDGYDSGAAGVLDGEIWYFAGRKNGSNSNEIWRSSGGAFTQNAFDSPAVVFESGVGHGAGQAALYLTPSTSNRVLRLAGDEGSPSSYVFFPYPKSPPGTGFLTNCANALVSIDDLIYVMGMTSGGRYNMHVYVPFEGSPVNPFTGDVAK